MPFRFYTYVDALYVKFLMLCKASSPPKVSKVASSVVAASERSSRLTLAGAACTVCRSKKYCAAAEAIAKVNIMEFAVNGRSDRGNVQTTYTYILHPMRTLNIEICNLRHLYYDAGAAHDLLLLSIRYCKSKDLCEAEEMRLRSCQNGKNEVDVDYGHWSGVIFPHRTKAIQRQIRLDEKS